MATITWNMGSNVEAVSIKTASALEIAIATIVAEHADSYPDTGAVGFLKDLAYGGCESGMVGELVYYRDTCAFYETHRREIATLLSEMLADVGADSPQGLFGEKWDREDPLALEETNQNLLAWFACEETARRLTQLARESLPDASAGARALETLL